MKKAIMVGAGNIGRGFIGMLLEQSGYHVVFADVNETLLSAMDEKGRYRVHTVDGGRDDIMVENYSTVNSSKDEFVNEVVESSLICTAVGLTVLPHVAPALAKGIAARREAGVTEELNIIACENAIRASSQLKEMVTGKLDADTAAYVDKYVGFPDCAVDCIIPIQGGDVSEVAVEHYHEWDVEKAAWKGDPAPIGDMEMVDSLDAYLERKLFILNGANAVTAFYGRYRGYETIIESLKDDEIGRMVRGMMDECSQMLVRRHGFAPEALEEYKRLVMKRFTNPYLSDDVRRVAREPMRKLAANDRLIAPMKYARGYGIATPDYYTGIALGLLYSDPDNEQSQRIQQMISEHGAAHTLCEVCGLDSADPDGEAILKEYERLSAKR